MNMTKINGGATIWARQTIDSEIFYNKPDKWFKIWFFIVNKVNHKTYRQWNRGQGFMTYTEIMEGTKATKDQVKKCFSWLRDQSMIGTARSTRGVTVTVFNYSRFQDLDNYSYKGSSTAQSTREALEKHQRSTTINKNDKNVNNENNFPGADAPGEVERVKLVKEVKETSKVTGSIKNSDVKKIGLKNSGVEINAAIEILSPINPDWRTWFLPGAQRTSVSKLLKFVKDDGNDLKQLVDKIMASRGKQYSVQIYTPSEMVEKYSKLITTREEVNSNVKEYEKRDPSRYKDKKPAVVFNNNK